jgi:hypothetical protein
VDFLVGGLLNAVIVGLWPITVLRSQNLEALQETLAKYLVKLPLKISMRAVKLSSLQLVCRLYSVPWCNSSLPRIQASIESF